VEVAVLIDGHNFVTLAESKANLGSLAGLEVLALSALLGLERNPLDKVLGDHGMLNGTNVNDDLVAFDSPDGNVLFNGSISGTGNHLFHLLAAAHNGHAGVLNLLDDVTTVSTNVILHNNFLLILLFIV
jgi:hypothetical protein